MKTWYREVRAVGLINWVWFVLWLRQNEFNPRLDLDVSKHTIEDMPRIARVRDRAHRIAMALNDIGR